VVLIDEVGLPVEVVEPLVDVLLLVVLVVVDRLVELLVTLEIEELDVVV